MARIMLVDDDQSTLQLFKSFLKDEDHEVLTASNYFEALDYLYDFNIDLAFIDINMPYRNGFDLLERIRRSPRFGDLPLSILSCRKDKKDVELAQKLGADQYLLKPITRIAFNQEVSNLLPARLDSDLTTLKLSNQPNMEVYGQLKIDFEVLSISEFGISLTCPVKLPIGQFIKVDSNIFDILDIIPAPLKVYSAQQYKPNNWRTGLQFVHLTTGQRQNLKDKILRIKATA